MEVYCIIKVKLEEIFLVGLAHAPFNNIGMLILQKNILYAYFDPLRPRVHYGGITLCNLFLLFGH